MRTKRAVAWDGFMTCMLAAGLQAEPLHPGAFPSLGVLELSDGDYVIDTSGPLPMLHRIGSPNALFAGILLDQNTPEEEPFWGFNPLIAVFSFDRIVIATNATLKAVGDHPVALLSRTFIRIEGLLRADGEDGENGSGNLGGTGNGLGGLGGAGGGKGGDGGTSKGENGAGPGGQNNNGAFGGFGGLSSRGNGAGFGGRGGGGFGGLVDSSPYGDLSQRLQGGAGGGGTGSDFALTKGAGGGGGGGGLELGALDSITITGKVTANGGNGGGGATVLAGGGSGGGLLLHAPTVTLNMLKANGGSPNGAGGRILVLTASGESVPGNMTVWHGAVGGEEGAIEFGRLDVPPVAPDRVLSIERTMADGVPSVRICWPTETNVTYQLQTNLALTAAGWGAFGPPRVGDGSTQCVVRPVAGSLRTFYRLELTP